VVRADQVEAGRLVRGLVGCPVCRAEWRIEGGVLHLGAPIAGTPSSRVDPVTLAALLGLSEPDALVVVDGLALEMVGELAASLGARVIVLDDEASPSAAGVIVGAERVPLGAGAVVAAFLARPYRSHAFIDSVINAVRAGGRVAGVGSFPERGDLAELARDDTLWVAERARPRVGITRRR